MRIQCRMHTHDISHGSQRTLSAALLRSSIIAYHRGPKTFRRINILRTLQTGDKHLPQEESQVYLPYLRLRKHTAMPVPTNSGSTAITLISQDITRPGIPSGPIREQIGRASCRE